MEAVFPAHEQQTFALFTPEFSVSQLPLVFFASCFVVCSVPFRVSFVLQPEFAASVPFKVPSRLATESIRILLRWYKVAPLNFIIHTARRRCLFFIFGGQGGPPQKDTCHPKIKNKHLLRAV